jgi:hypothetical protein
MSQGPAMFHQENDGNQPNLLQIIAAVVSALGANPLRRLNKFWMPREDSNLD